MTITVLKAQTIITMDPSKPRATAVAFDDQTGRIVALGDSVEELGVKADKVEDLGNVAIAPGFIEPHGHPVLSGLLTSPPYHYIFLDLTTWDNLKKFFEKTHAEAPAGDPLVFFGYDKMLLSRSPPTGAEMDEIFGKDRVAIVIDNSGHACYVTTAAIVAAGMDPKATDIPNPVGGSFGRNADNSLNGWAFESSGVLAMASSALKLVKNPIASAKAYYEKMAAGGLTSSSELTYASKLKPAYEVLANTPGCPVRVVCYHMSTEPDCAEKVTFNAPPNMLMKRGIKLWSDGSPWVGNIANSFPYLSNETTKLAGIDPKYIHMGEKALNYTLDELKAILDKNIAGTTEKYQFAFHCNGNIAIKTSLDAYEYALNKYNLMGTDHRWRLEHLGAGNKELFERAAQLGVTVSMGPFQFYYWGHLLDGKMFESKLGSQWQPFNDAFAVSKDIHPTFHNDGMVSPPIPMINIQTAVTRMCKAGSVHGPNQIITLEQAFKTHTVNAAWQLGLEKDIGSLEVGKFADFVILSKDPWQVKDLKKLATESEVLGTYIGGKKFDSKVFSESGPVPYHASVNDYFVSAFGTSCCSLPRRK